MPSSLSANIDDLEKAVTTIERTLTLMIGFIIAFNAGRVGHIALQHRRPVSARSSRVESTLTMGRGVADSPERSSVVRVIGYLRRAHQSVQLTFCNSGQTICSRLS